MNVTPFKIVPIRYALKPAFSPIPETLLELDLLVLSGTHFQSNLMLEKDETLRFYLFLGTEVSHKGHCLVNMVTEESLQFFYKKCTKNTRVWADALSWCKNHELFRHKCRLYKNGLERVNNIYCINRFTPLCKNLFNLLEFLAEAIPLGPSSIENDAHGIENLLIKTQVKWTRSCIVKWIY